MALKESDTSLKEVTAKFRARIEEQEKEYEKKILDSTPYDKREKEYNKAHKRFRLFAHILVGIITLISVLFVVFIVLPAVGSCFWPWLKGCDREIYDIIPAILALALLVGTPMIWQTHALFREAAKYHALREDAFTKGQIVLFIARVSYDDKTRSHLIRRFITYHERHSSAHLILSTKPPSIPQKSGFDSINLKNLIKPKSD